MYKNVTYSIPYQALMRQTYALQMLLAIKDAVSPDSSDYNVLLANTNGVPERKKGLNNLKHDVTVTVAYNKLVGAHGGRSGHLVLFLVALSFSKLQILLNNIPEGNPHSENCIYIQAYVVSEWPRCIYFSFHIFTVNV